MGSMILKTLTLCSYGLLYLTAMLLCALFSTVQHRVTSTTKGVLPLMARGLSFVVILVCLRKAGAKSDLITLMALTLSSLAGSRIVVFGLTGGIACGKSTVSNELVDNGWTVIDADKISREIMDTNEELKRLVISTFGEEVIERNSAGLTIDRTKLGSIIFANPQKRKLLNSMTHPRIFREIFTQIVKARILSWRERVIIDAPLLFESKIMEYFCHPIITVYIKDEQVQL
jgi:dephospho-CoA kinase